MSFKIEAQEYEDAQKVKQSSIRYEIAEALRQVDYLENRYEQRRKMIEHRKRDLLWSAGIHIGVAVALCLLGIMFACLSSPLFGWITVILCEGLAFIVLISTMRIFFSWAAHKGMFDMPEHIIRKFLLNGRNIRFDGDDGRVYTLKQEEEDCGMLQRQLERDKQSLRKFLEQSDANEEHGKRLLEGILPSLNEDERHATYLYGEKV